MSLISIKRLIAKKEVSDLLRDILAASGGCAWISSPEGKVLFGAPEAGADIELPVEFEGELLCRLHGKGNISTIASLLKYIAVTENEKKTLGRETLGKYKEITMLYDFAERVASCLDPGEVARLVSEEAMKVIRADRVSVMTCAKDTPDTLRTIYSSLTEGDALSLKAGEGIAGCVFERGKAEIVNDAASDPRYVPTQFRVSSLLCAPLRIKDRIIGVINVISEEPWGYTAEDLKLLSALAAQAAASIENALLYDELRETFFTTVHTLAETIEKRDPYTGGHTKRVMEYSLAIGREMGLSEEAMTSLRLSAILHDIGKIGVRDSILMKESKLTDEEFDAIKMHTIYGHEILAHVKQMNEVIPGVRQHHEKYDGRGYPDRLRAEEIDIKARIIGVADSFDAMTSNRPYRRGLSLDIAFGELRKNSGSQFDAEAVKAFFAAYEKGLISLDDQGQEAAQ